MKRPILILAAIALVSCTPKKDDAQPSPSTQANPFEGNTYYLYGNSSANSGTMIASISFKNSQVLATTILMPSSSPNQAIYRKNVGTYEISGSTYIFHYSYETCNPVHTETFEIKSSDPADSITVRPVNSATTMILRNDTKYTPASLSLVSNLNNLATMTEDVGCSKIANLKEAGNKDRMPASTTGFSLSINHINSVKN